MQANIAPQIQRKHWGFHAWKGYDMALLERSLEWSKISRKSTDKRSVFWFWSSSIIACCKKAKQKWSPQALAKQFAGNKVILLLLKKSLPRAETGTLICNPPYGERLGTNTCTNRPLFGIWSAFKTAIYRLECFDFQRRTLNYSTACVCVQLVNLKRKMDRLIACKKLLHHATSWKYRAKRTGI